MELTPAIDYELRTYAKRLDWDYGEDAYHTAIEQFLQKPVMVRSLVAFLKHATKCLVAHRFRDTTREYIHAGSYVQGGLPIGCVNLRAGQQRGVAKKTVCRLGHPLEGENVTLTGADKHRTCRICRNASSLASYHKMKGVNPCPSTI